MAFINSPTGGGTYCLQTRDEPVDYRSQSRLYGTGVTPGFEDINRLEYSLDGNIFATHTFSTASGTGADPQGMPNLVAPLTSDAPGPRTLLVEAYDANNNLLSNETVSLVLTYAQCNDPTSESNITQTSADITADAVVVTGGYTAVVHWGTTPGGPYPNDTPATTTPPATIDASLSGLAPGTTYYYVVETFFPDSSRLGLSDEASFTTLAAQSTLDITCPADRSDPTGPSVPIVVPNASGGVTPYTFSATNLPPGIIINPNTGQMTGGPTVPGNYLVEVTVTDDNNDMATCTFNWEITQGDVADLTVSKVGISPSQFITAGDSYTYEVEFRQITSLATANNVTLSDLVPATPPGRTRTWTLVFQTGNISPALPANGVGDLLITGLTLDGVCIIRYEITDTFPEVGSFDNTATATADAPVEPAEDTFGAPFVSTVECAPATNITDSTADLNGEIFGGPAQSSRFEWGLVSGGPYTEQGPIISGGAGTHSDTATGLLPNTTYYYIYRTFSDVTGDNEVSSSSECSFTTAEAVVEPSATCSPATDVTASTATLNGTLAGDLPPGGSARFRVGTMPGNYTLTFPATPYAVGPVTGSATGLNANTNYFYRLEILDSGNAVVVTSGECNFVTQSQVAPVGGVCPPPPGASKCPPIGTFSVGGVEYMALEICDDSGPIIAVYEICNGFISGEPTYYNLDGTEHTLVGAPQQCPLTSDDFEQEVFCDQGNGDQPFISRIVFSESGDLVPEMTGTFELDQTTPYTVVGPVAVCQSGNQVTVEPACIFSNTTNLVLDHVEIVKVIQPATGNIINMRIFNLDRTVEYTLPLPEGNHLGTCDPEALCTPDPAVDIAGGCGPGETVSQPIVEGEGVLTDAVIIDDPEADALCGGGTWAPTGTQPAGFPIDESLRNNSFDTGDANWTLQGGGMSTGGGGAHLTSGVEDPSGQGYLRLSDGNAFSNGAAIYNEVFSNAENVTAEVDWASWGGTSSTSNGGDGWSQIFTDGAQAPQDNPAGGGGSLGLGNVDHGYLAVVLDEFGGSGPPGGFNFNRLKVFCLAPGDKPPGVNPTQIFDTPLAPETVNNHPRSARPRLRTSIITEAGQTYVSVSIRWPGDDEFTVYLDRFNVSGTCGLAPSTLRTGFTASSGGAFQSIHELRGLSIRSGGRIAWRGLDVFNNDDIPECATDIRVGACVDVTISSSTEEQADADDEIYLWLVNTATGEILDRSEFSSIPSQVGQTRNLCVEAIVDPADYPNIRLYVGSKLRDSSGTYGAVWENLEVDVAALGCPPRQVRTVPISAPCPLPVTLVASGGGGSSVFNAAPSIDFEAICADGAPAFRREVRNVDGSIEVDYLGQNGDLITPQEWVPGDCTSDQYQLEPFCFIVNADPLTVHSGYAVVRLSETSATTLFYYEIDSGVTHQPGAVTPVECPSDQEPLILCDDNGLFLRHVVYGSYGNILAVRDTEVDGTTPYLPVGEVKNCSPSGSVAEFILCDDDGEFIRKFIQDEDGAVTAVVDLDLSGQPYTPVGDVKRCDCIPTALDPVCYQGNPQTVDLSTTPWVIDSPVEAHKTVPGFGDITVRRISGPHTLVNGNTTPCTGANRPNSIGIVNPGGPPYSTSTYEFVFPAPVNPFEVDVIDLDNAGGAAIETFISPSHGDADFLPANALQPGGPGTPYRSNANNQTVTFQWTDPPAGPFQASFTGACLQFDFGDVTFVEEGKASVLRDCDGNLTYIDQETGEELDPEEINIIDCPCPCANPPQLIPVCFTDNTEPTLVRTGYKVVNVEETTTTRLYYYETSTGTVFGINTVTEVECPGVGSVSEFILCDGDDVKFIRKFIQDEDGAVTSVVNLTLEGQPYTPVGTVSTCDCEQFEYEVCYAESAGDINNGFDTNLAPDELLGVAQNPSYIYGDPISSWSGRFNAAANTPARATYSANGSVINMASFVPALPQSNGTPVPVLASPYTGTQVIAGGIVVTLNLSGNVARQTGAQDLRMSPVANIALSFSEPVDNFTITTAGFADPPTSQERFENVEVQRALTSNVRGTAVRDCDGTVTIYSRNGQVVEDAEVADCADGTIYQHQEILCDDNGEFIRKFLEDAEGTVTGIVDLDLDGAPYTVVGTVHVCEAPAVRIDSTVQRQAGAGAINIAANARSVTVTVLAGIPTVSIGGGPAVPLAPGVSLSWAATESGEVLDDAFVFTGVAGSDFIVTTTRNI